eukprot:CAMPEP_0175993290 /NCGR_PEP_ID=MMETSP0108-20121206/53879_1 /TAXON_ID=195067 ORGANISM="Goniomonas pacifica, Strain CCMP1869" /NCGR_SAMPLE_ID=MMETSP0108 /ASSEMBLY_ACC=CAM_ASM_000204 /LENGTH=140 /DNA_ID=CAMNT_0017325055 /DNA_START=164 /DNA_END=586 /DNA_ORIENTATION=-
MSRRTGRPLHFVDSEAVLLTSVSSLAVLTQAAKEMGSSIPHLSMRNFRPNIVVAGAQPFAESSWETLRIGHGTVLQGVKDCERCQVVNVDPSAGVVQRGGLTLLKSIPPTTIGKKTRFGRLFSPVECGRIQIGDRVVMEH